MDTQPASFAATAGTFAVVHARLIPLDAVTPRLLAAWRDLAAHAAEPNPFHEPEMVLTAGRHLSCAAPISLALVESEGRLHACLPVWSGRYWGRVPLRAVQAWRHEYCFVGTPLLDRDRPVETATTLLGLLSDAHVGGMLVLDRCAVGGPVHAAFGIAAASHRTQVHIDWSFERAVARAADPAPIGLRGKHMKDLRRQRRRMESELGGGLAVDDRAPDDHAIGIFLKLEASGWKAATGTPMARHDEGFFRDLCDAFSKGDRIRFIALGTKEHTVSMLCTIRAEHEYYWFKIAFAKEYGEASPGRQLMLGVTAQLKDAPPQTVYDSCAQPDNETINRLWTGRRGFATLLVPLRGLAQRPVNALASASARRHLGRGEST